MLNELRTKILKGKSISLRPLQENDAEITFRWRNLDRAALLNKGSATVEEQKKWIQNRPSNEFNFVIELLDGTPVGMLSLVKVDILNKTAESARFLIGEAEKVKGIPAAVEAMLLLYVFAFDELKLNRIYGTISRQNGMMIKWQKYLGMKEEGTLRQHYYIDNKFHDAVMMGILQSEFQNEALKKMKVLARW